jgi:protoheme IX farnesyltransferase
VRGIPASCLSRARSVSNSLTSTVYDHASPVAVAAAPVADPGTFRSLIETTKPGITKLVTITSFVGFVMSSASQQWVGWSLAWTGLATVIGTALSAAGANAINQWMERDRDAIMPRTVKRPLPTGRLTPALVIFTGTMLSIFGCLVLWLFTGIVPAAVALACVISYVVFYTPMKTRTSLSTFVGAIPGALPPLIGWSAGSAITPAQGFSSLLEWGGLSLFILMFVWQIPHFLAIAWMYKDDYAKGGYVVLPVIDSTGSWTASTIALWTLALIPATLLPAIVMPDHLGLPYLLIASICVLVFALLAGRLVITRTRPAARAVFFASIIHLPLILLMMVGETVGRALLR